MITEEQLLELGFKQVDPVWQARGHRFESGILHIKAQANTAPKRGRVFCFIRVVTSLI